VKKITRALRSDSRVSRNLKSNGVRLFLGLTGAVLLNIVLASAAAAAAPSTTYTYDSAGRLVGTKAANGTTTQYVLDAAGNRVTVAIAKDTTPPTVPTGLSATASSSTQVVLSWTAASDSGAGVGGYYIYRGGSQIGTSTTSTFTDSTTTCNTAYSYTVAAYDNAAPPNVSAQSSAAGVTTPVTSPPSVPTGLTKASATSTQVVLSWMASSDSCTSVAGYRVYRGGVQIGTSATTSYTDSTTSGTTAYSYTVAAYDSFGNVSGQSSPLAVTTPDTIPPSVPTGLTAGSVTAGQAAFSWAASTDTGGSGLRGYTVFRNGAQIGTTATNSYNDTTVVPGATYSYTVSAQDGAGNSSAQSSALSITIPSTFQITDANGNIIPAAASLYSKATTCSTLLNSCQLTLSTTYGTPKTVYSFRDHNNANPCPDDSGAVFSVSATAGYSQPSNTSCIIVATPAVYGH
jgi:YD repeat-containing protein